MINTNYLKEGDYSLARTVVHETRHAYQYEAIDGNHPVVSQETIDAWSVECSDDYVYIPYRSKDNGKANYSQATEWDAKSFAGKTSDLERSGSDPKYRGSW